MKKLRYTDKLWNIKNSVGVMLMENIVMKVEV